MYESDERISKWKVEVQVELDNGTRLLGFLFVTPTQRLSDLLNDPREFLPVQTPEGLIVHLRKSTIARVTQLDQAADAGAATDPYEILGVSPRVGNEDLRSAYHELCAQHHPDKLVALGLAAEIESYLAATAKDKQPAAGEKAPELKFRGDEGTPTPGRDDDILSRNKKTFDENPVLRNVYYRSPIASLRLLRRFREAANQIKK